MISEPQKALEVKNLSVTYGRRLVLNEVSLSLQKGDMMGIVGPNGSGKSTLLKAIFNKIPRLKGQTYLFGKDVSNNSDYQLVRSGVSYMVQGGSIFSSMTVDEHLVICTLHKDKPNRKNLKDMVYSQFPTLAASRGIRAGNLSGGQRQILSLGILIAQDTKVWLLDEPLAGIDKEAIELTIDFLSKSIEEREVAMIIIEHNKSLFKQIPSLVYHIEKGMLS